MSDLVASIISIVVSKLCVAVKDRFQWQFSIFVERQMPRGYLNCNTFAQFSQPPQQEFGCIRARGSGMKLVGKKSAWEYLILTDYIWYETSLFWAFGLLFCFQPPHIKIISNYPWVSKVTCIRLQGRRWTPSKVEDKHGVGEMPKWEIWHNDFQLWTLGMYCGYTVHLISPKLPLLFSAAEATSRVTPFFVI